MNRKPSDYELRYLTQYQVNVCAQWLSEISERLYDRFDVPVRGIVWSWADRPSWSLGLTMFITVADIDAYSGNRDYDEYERVITAWGDEYENCDPSRRAHGLYKILLHEFAHVLHNYRRHHNLCGPSRTHGKEFRAAIRDVTDEFKWLDQPVLDFFGPEIYEVIKCASTVAQW